MQSKLLPSEEHSAEQDEVVHTKSQPPALPHVPITNTKHSVPNFHTLHVTEPLVTTPVSETAEELVTKAKLTTRTRNRLQMTGSLALLASLPFLWLWLWLARGAQFSASVVLSVVIGFTVLGTAAVAMIRRANRSVGYDTEILTQHGGIKAIPALIESLGVDGTRATREPVYRALAKLLPQLKASDAALLSQQHRFRLNHLLMLEMETGFLYKPDLDCSLAILKALEQVGDDMSIQFVKKLASRRPRSERGRLLRQAAEKCLPLLEANCSAVHSVQTLLRASAAENDASDRLLRPVTESCETDHLLRAASSEHQ